MEYKNIRTIVYVIARVLVGLLFLQHGLQKTFGVFGSQASSLFSLMGLAGVIELDVGITVTLGLLTRWFAALGALQMLVAYFMAHAFNAFPPVVKGGGELALLYFAVFLLILAKGGSKFSLDCYLKR